MAHGSVMATSPTAAFPIRPVIRYPSRALRVHGGLLCLPPWNGALWRTLRPAV